MKALGILGWSLSLLIPQSPLSPIMTDHIWGTWLAVACIKDSHDLPEIWFFQRSWLISAASVNYKVPRKAVAPSKHSSRLTCLSYACREGSMGTSPEGLPASQLSESQRSQNKGGKVQGRVRAFSAGCLPTSLPELHQQCRHLRVPSHPALAALSAPGMFCSLRLSTCPSSRTSFAHKGCYPRGKFPAGPSLASWVTHPPLSGLSQRGWPLKEPFINHSVCYITVSGCLYSRHDIQASI